MGVNRALSEAEVATALRGSGRRVTAARLLVYRLLQESDGHVTAEGILGMALERGERITLPSIYAALTTLVDLKLARVAHVLPGGAITYDARADRHHHLVCRACGRIDDIDCAAREAPCLEPAAGHGFDVETAEVTYVGLCPACRADIQISKDAPGDGR